MGQFQEWTAGALDGQTGSLTKRNCGQYWERHAERFLQHKGLQTMVRNFNCRLGEIDLIMTDQETLVFVEVRYRGAGSLASSLESVTPRKQLRVSLAAGIFLNRNPVLAQKPCRFDVVAVDGNDNEQETRWIQNAFTSALQ